MSAKLQVSVLHIVIGISGVLALSLLTGCQKISEKPPELGPEVSAEAIDNEFSKVIREINPFDTKAGDYLFYVINRKIENQSEPTALGTLGRAVKSVVPLNRGYRFIIHTVDHQLNFENSQLEKVRDEDCVLELTSQVTYTCPSDPPNEALAKSASVIEKAVTQSSNDLISVKYYNLQTSTATVTPSERIKNNPNCSGLTPCQLNLTYIRYDIVAKYSDGSLRRFRVDRSITPDLRYMGPDGIDYEVCISTSIDYQGRPVFLRDCTFLHDLIKTP